MSSYHFASFNNIFLGVLYGFELCAILYILYSLSEILKISLKRFVFLFESENQDEIQNNLSAYLFPVQKKQVSDVAQEYVYLLEKQLNKSLSKTKFKGLFPFKYMVLACICIFAFSSPSLKDDVMQSRQWIAFQSIYNPLSSQLTFQLTDASKAYLKNQAFALDIAIQGIPLFPIQMKVLDKNGELLEQHAASKFIQLEKNKFKLSFQLKGFSQKVFVQCLSGADQSQQFALNMVDFPRVTKSAFELEYPKYLKKSPKQLSYLPQAILHGSNLTETVSFNKSLNEVQVPNAEVKAGLEKNQYQFSFDVQKKLEYQIEFQDHDGFHSKSRKRLVNVKQDELPSIKVLSPISPKKIPSGILERLPVKLKISDDFLVERVQVEITSRQKFEMTYMSSQEQIEIPIKSSDQLVIETSLELGSIYLQEGDKVKFVVKAWDQLRSRGPALSMTGILYVPYMFEEAMESEEKAQDIMEDLQEIAKEQKIQEAASKTLSKKRDSQKNVSAVDQKKFKDLLKKQKALQQKAKEVDKKISESLKNDRDKNLLDEATLQKLEQVKDIYQELMSQMDRDVSKMAQMNNSMKNMSQKQMNKMMKKFDSKKYSQELDRTLKALKKVQAKRKLQTNLKKIEQLKKEHDKLQKALKENKGDQKQALKDLQKKWEDIKKSLEKLKKDENLDQALKDELENKTDTMKELSKQYQKMSKNLQNQDKKGAKQNNKEISKSLEKMKKDIKESIAKAKKEVMKVDLEKLDKFLKESNAQSKFLLQIKNQISFYEGLKRKRYAAQEFSFLRASALHLQNQMNKEYQENLSFSKTCIRIAKLLQEQITKAVKDYESDRPPLNAKPIYDAFATNNQQTLLLLNLKEQLEKQKQQSQMQQFMDSLEQISNDQQKLNQQTQKMGQSMSQKSQYEQEQMQEQMSFQQELIRKSTEKLYESYQDKLKLAKKLGAISKEMKEVEQGIKANDLSKGSKTQKKQNKIEYKLLEMQNAMKEQKESKKRKAKSSKKQSLQEGLDSEISKTKTQVNIYRDLDIPKRFQGLIQGYFQSVDQK
ncbi:MAG: hypothetical protein KC646_02885 [Candidatus Cloacimonetes bacterium]|nr:hypothetical protein [Candidatus Cloacimonadota bacterium]